MTTKDFDCIPALPMARVDDVASQPGYPGQK